MCKAISFNAYVQEYYIWNYEFSLDFPVFVVMKGVCLNGVRFWCSCKYLHSHKRYVRALARHGSSWQMCSRAISSSWFLEITVVHKRERVVLWEKPQNLQEVFAGNLNWHDAIKNILIHSQSSFQDFFLNIHVQLFIIFVNIHI